MRWLLPPVTALALCSFVLVLPRAAQAECPPAVDPASGLDTVLNPDLLTYPLSEMSG